MRDRDLKAFLASVRRTRFVDYLDPLGETAQAALERRLSWARVSQNDPAHAEEARFLLDNAGSLRDLLRRELEEDDWIEESAAGREWGFQPRTTTLKRTAVRVPDNDRVTEIFNTDDLRTENSQEGASPRPVGRPRPTAVSPPPKPQDRVVAPEEVDNQYPDWDDDNLPTGIMRIEDLAESPSASKHGVPDVPAAVVAGMASRGASGRSAVRDDDEFTDVGCTPVGIGDERMTVPSALTRNRRTAPLQFDPPAPPAPDSARSGSAVRATNVPQPPSSRAPLVLGLVGLLGLVGVVGLGLVVAVPTILAGSDTPDPEPSQRIAPAEPAPVVAVKPAPVVAAEPAPVVAAEPAPVVAAEPAPVVAAEPAPVVAAEPAPVVEPEPAPVVAAEPAPVVAAEPAPVVEPEPAPVVEPDAVAVADAPAPEPAGPGSFRDLRGLWIGSGMKLTVANQDGPSFAGKAEIQIDDGSWRTLQVSGVLDGSIISFSGGEAYFSGTVSGPLAKGTYTLDPGASPKDWSVFK